MQVFLLFYLLKAQDVTFYGNWSDSYFYNEVLLFFEEINYTMISTVEKRLDNVMDINFTSVLESLDEVISPDIFGLLNLSLTNRYFHLKSMIKVPKVRSQPLINGWNAFCRRSKAKSARLNNLSQKNLENIQWKLLSGLSKIQNPHEKLEYLHSFSHDFSNFSKNLFNIQINETEKEIYQKTKLSKSRSVNNLIINGRVCEHDILNAVKCLVEENKVNTSRFYYFNASSTISSANHTNHNRKISLENYFLNSNYYDDFDDDDIFYYTDVPKFEWGARFYRPEVTGAYTKEFNLRDDVKPLDFLKNMSPMINLDIYFTFSSAEYHSLLDLALRIEKEKLPIITNMFAIPQNFENETEKKMCFAFMDLTKLGGRPPVFFLEEMQKVSSIKRAYASTYPQTSWKDLECLYTGGSTLKKIMELDSFCKKHRIAKAAVAVNGEFVRETPVFPHVMDYVIKHAKRLQKSAREGRIRPRDDFKKWSMENAIQIEGIRPLIEFDERNYMSLDGFTTLEIYNIVLELLPGYGYEDGDEDQIDNFYGYNYNFDGSADNRIPVFFINYEADMNSPMIETFNITECSPLAMKFLRVSSEETCTVVGPLRFSGQINETTLSAAIRYIDLVHMRNLPSSPLPIHLRTFELLLSGHRKITKTKIVNRKDDYSYSFKVKTNNHKVYTNISNNACYLNNTNNVININSTNNTNKDNINSTYNSSSINNSNSTNNENSTHSINDTNYTDYTDNTGDTINDTFYTDDANDTIKINVSDISSNSSVINNTNNTNISVNFSNTSEISNIIDISNIGGIIEINSINNISNISKYSANSNRNRNIFTVRLEMSPFDPGFPAAIDTVLQIVDSGAANVEIVPIFPEGPITSIPKFMYSKHKRSVNGSVSCKHGIESFEYPPQWAVNYLNDSFYYIDSIMSTGFLDNADVFQIGDVQRAASSFHGFYMINNLPGNYETVGVQQPIYSIDSLVPIPTVIGGNGEKIVLKERDEMNVLTTGNNDNYRTMLFTLKRNATKRLKMNVIIHQPVHQPFIQQRENQSDNFRNGNNNNNNYNNNIINYIPLFLPPFVSRPETIEESSQIMAALLIDSMFLSNILIVEPDIIWLNDATKFENLKMKKAVVAMPEMTNDREFEKKQEWMKQNILIERVGRPYHNTAVMWFDVRRWGMKNGLFYFLQLYENKKRSGTLSPHINQQLMNILQLKIQTITLYNRLAYCTKYNNFVNPKFKGLISIQMCDNNSATLIGEPLDELRKKALEELF